MRSPLDHQLGARCHRTGEPAPRGASSSTSSATEVHGQAFVAAVAVLVRAAVLFAGPAEQHRTRHQLVHAAAAVAAEGAALDERHRPAVVRLPIGALMRAGVAAVGHHRHRAFDQRARLRHRNGSVEAGCTARAASATTPRTRVDRPALVFAHRLLHSSAAACSRGAAPAPRCGGASARSAGCRAARTPRRPGAASTEKAEQAIRQQHAAPPRRTRRSRSPT